LYTLLANRVYMLLANCVYMLLANRVYIVHTSGQLCVHASGQPCVRALQMHEKELTVQQAKQAHFNNVKNNLVPVLLKLLCRCVRRS